MVELMIALSIFMLITGAVFSLYINSNRSYNEDEIYSRMQENGRYAINRLAEDLRMSDFWGEMIDPVAITGGAFGVDCTLGLGTTDEGLVYYDYTAPGAFDPSGCSIMASDPDGDGDTDMKANTNAVGIKRVSNGYYDPVKYAGVHLWTNGYAGAFQTKAVNDTTSDPNFQYWLYVPALYFIKDDDGTPYLCRAALNGGNALQDIGEAEDDCIAEGVEQLHIEFGMDDDGDGIADQYRNDTLEDAVTARVYLLVRSDRAVPSYVNDKTYTLGTLATMGPFNDSFYRRVFSTTVVLRNPRALAKLGL